MGFYNYGNIAKDTSVKPGSCKLLIGPKSYFSAIAAPSTHAAAGDSKTISGDHTFTVGKGFIECLGTVKQKSTGKGSTVGEMGSKTMKMEITAMVGGTSAALLEFIEGGLNNDFIILAADGCLCGVDADQYLQFGCENLPAQLSAEIDLGTVEGGFKGVTLKFESYGVPNVYTGDITLYGA